MAMANLLLNVLEDETVRVQVTVKVTADLQASYPSLNEYPFRTIKVGKVVNAGAGLLIGQGDEGPIDLLVRDDGIAFLLEDVVSFSVAD